MKLQVNNKPVSQLDKQTYKDRKELIKDFGDIDVYAIIKYVRRLEKRIEALENK